MKDMVYILISEAEEYFSKYICKMEHNNNEQMFFRGHFIQWNIVKRVFKQYFIKVAESFLLDGEENKLIKVHRISTKFNDPDLDKGCSIYKKVKVDPKLLFLDGVLVIYRGHEIGFVGIDSGGNFYAHMPDTAKMFMFTRRQIKI